MGQRISDRFHAVGAGECGHDGADPGAFRAERGGLVDHDDGGFSADSGKSVPSSSRTRWAIDPWASPPAPESAPFTVIASETAASAAISQTSINGFRRRAENRPSRENYWIGRGWRGRCVCE